MKWWIKCRKSNGIYHFVYEKSRCK